MKKVVEYEVEANNMKTIHTTLIKDWHKNEFNHAGAKFKIIRGWQPFKIAGSEIKIRVLREWAY